MTAYRLYHLDGSGRVSTAEWIDADSDDAAIAACRALRRPVELWQRNRLVARVTPPERGRP